MFVLVLSRRGHSHPGGKGAVVGALCPVIASSVGKQREMSPDVRSLPLIQSGVALPMLWVELPLTPIKPLWEYWHLLGGSKSNRIENTNHRVHISPSWVGSCS